MENALLRPLKDKLSSYLPYVVRYRKQLSVALSGLLLVLLGSLIYTSGVFEPARVEVLSETDQVREETAKSIVVEIEGAVINPGVYTLQEGDRVEHALIKGGGLAQGADREWVSKSLNRAAKVFDGQKIYIPKKGETVANVGQIRGVSSGLGGSVGGLINLNTASTSELDSLPGIGAVRAKAIIEGRPYASVEEFSSKKIVPSNVFEDIKGLITAP